jgi:TPR repeat protein
LRDDAIVAHHEGKKWAEANFPSSLLDPAKTSYSKGFKFYKGENCVVDMQKAVRFLTISSDLGYHHAQFLLGLIYINGYDDVEVDYQKSLRYFRLAADQGNHKAQYHLGVVYLHGAMGQVTDLPKALYFLSASADQGYVNSLSVLGMAYMFGDSGVELDKPLGSHYFRLAINKRVNKEESEFTAYRYALRLIESCPSLLTYCVDDVDEGEDEGDDDVDEGEDEGDDYDGLCVEYLWDYKNGEVTLEELSLIYSDGIKKKIRKT